MKTLIVVDMQNDFIDGALGSSEAVAIVPNVKKKIEEYRANGYHVVFTKDTHFDNYLETQEGKYLPVKHCVARTDGWNITADIDVKEDRVISKCAFGFNWFDYAEAPWFNSVDEIELVGLCTDICVISNAMILKAAFKEIPIVVDASCCAGVTSESHKNALEAMKMCQIEIRGDY